MANDSGLLSGTVKHEVEPESVRELALWGGLVMVGGIIFSWLINKL